MTAEAGFDHPVVQTEREVRRVPLARGRVFHSIVLIGLALLAVGRSHLGTRLDGFTYDEPWHIVAGVEYLRTGDYRLNPEHPPLIKLVAGAAIPESFRMPPPAQLSEKTQERDYVERVMFLDNEGLQYQQRVRAAVWAFNGLLILAFGLLIWYGAGFVWACGALLFLAIDPTIAAHLPLVMTDLPLALALGVAAVAAGILATEWRWHWAAVTGIALGLALGSKHSALPAVVAIVLALFASAAVSGRGHAQRSRRRRVFHVAAACALAVLLLWAQYGFQYHAGPDGSDAFNRPIDAKLGDVQSPLIRRMLIAADASRLLPRAYTWGLSDTVRAGVEGRGQPLHFVMGKQHYGSPPLHTWPTFVLLKLPLASIALILFGAVLLLRGHLNRRTRWVLWFALAAGTSHLLALTASQATYGGVRHALPLIVLMALLAGAALSITWRTRSRSLLLIAAALFVTSFAMTAGEPRVFGYHNEIGGGSERAHHYVANEGLGMGQRFPELLAFYESEVRPTGLPIYFNYWIIEEEAKAAGVDFRRRASGLDDTNVEGKYDGFYVYNMAYELEWPGWNPEQNFAGTRRVARFGDMGIWRGTQTLPLTRAASMYERVLEYIYEEGGSDWTLVTQRLEEVAAKIPHNVGAAVELSNAYLRLGDGPAAKRALQRVFEQNTLPVEELVAEQIRQQIALIDSASDVSHVALLRNPWME